MSIPIDDDPELARAIRHERYGVLIGRLVDLQFSDDVDPQKIESAVLFLDQEHRDTQEEQRYFSEREIGNA